jgi:hypothetical protein
MTIPKEKRNILIITLTIFVVVLIGMILTIIYLS